MIRHFLILSLILGFLNLTASENLPRTTSIDKIKVGKILPTSNLSSKKIKYFLDGEKASFINLSRTQIMTLDFCCGGSGEVQRINVKFFDKNLTKRLYKFQQNKRFHYKFWHKTWRQTRPNFKNQTIYKKKTPFLSSPTSLSKMKATSCKNLICHSTMRNSSFLMEF